MLNVPSSPSVRYEAVAGTLDEAVRRRFLLVPFTASIPPGATRRRPPESACVLMGGIQ